jgi:radical SAM family RiPP maturation amino acid epimerase
VVDDLYEGFAPDEIQVLAESKRFVERYIGDPEFRRVFVEAPTERPEMLLDLNVRLASLEWEALLRHPGKGRGYCLQESDLASYPALRLWKEWNKSFQQQVQDLREAWVAENNPRLAAWRKRATRRFVSEIGAISGAGVFPLFVYELSKGCSIGCWFCGLSAGRFEGYFPYTEKNARLWRELLTIGMDLCGPGCKAVICFHGTEPFDNPDYLTFLRDVHACYGVYPQTTTAAPLRNVALTRELLRLRETCPILPDRFSVLSVSALRKIHRTFSLHELRYVQMVLQNPGALSYKTNCGRARARPDKVRKNHNFVNQFAPSKFPADPRTIECVCGYLVNMVEGSIKLISPSPASDESPNGYRIHAAGIFRDASEYKAFLERTMEEFMPLAPSWQIPLSFRPDLTFTRLEDGFSLTSKAFRHSLKGKAWYGALGDRIARGDATRGEIIVQLGSEGISLVEVTASIQKLFERGLLEEDCPVKPLEAGT